MFWLICWILAPHFREDKFRENDENENKPKLNFEMTCRDLTDLRVSDILDAYGKHQ